jgi:hypothetical protein
MLYSDMDIGVGIWLQFGSPIQIFFFMANDVGAELAI